MRLRLVAVPLAALVLAGCAQSKHAAIADYITRVNAVESGMAGSLNLVSTVNQRFAKSQGDPTIVGDLAKSQQTLRRLRHRLVLIVPPAEAKHLHTLLLQVVDEEVGLADEVHQLAVFNGSYRTALTPLAAASTKLKQKLGESAKGTAATKQLNTEKADALTAYAATLASVRASLETLDPPVVWRPTYTQQLASLAQLRSAALALAAAIRTNDAQAIPKLLERFDAAAVSNQSVAAQKREIAAVNAYNGRIRKIVRLAQRVQRERVALQKKYK